MRSGINDRCRRALSVFAEAVALASQKSDGIVVCGDLFDSSKVEPQIVAEVADILSNGLPTLILVGNHDQHSDDEGDHALAVLAHANATVVEKPSVCSLVKETPVSVRWITCKNMFTEYPRPDRVVWAVPYASGKGVDVLRVGLAECARQHELAKHEDAEILLAFHLGVSDEDTPPWLRSADDSIHIDDLLDLMQKYNIFTAFAGNWHERKVWVEAGRVVTQIGALCPTGWDNPGLSGYGGCDVLTGRNELQHNVIPGPRFLKFAVKDATKISKNADHYIQIVGTRDELDAMDPIDTALGQHIELVVDASEAKAEAVRASIGARSADTLEEAISAFLSETPLDSDIQREELVAVVRNYLKV